MKYRKMGKELTLFVLPDCVMFLLDIELASIAGGPDVPTVICAPAPPRRFLFSLPTLGGGAKFPMGGILVSGLGV
jgi:hypothetical protein